MKIGNKDVDQESLKQYSKDELLSLAEAGLDLAKDRHRRLQKAGYGKDGDLGSYINNFNRTITKKRLEEDTVGQLKEDIQYIAMHLNSENTSVLGRRQKGRDILNELGHKAWGWEADEKVKFSTRGGRHFKLPDGTTISEKQLEDFFQFARELEDSTLWKEDYVVTDYSVLSTVYDDYFADPTIATDSAKFEQMIKKINTLVNKKWGHLRPKPKDSFNATKAGKERRD